MPKINNHDHTGQTFGDWTIVSRAAWVISKKPSSKGYFHRYDRWLGKCVCGVEREIFGQSLRNGTSHGCGCTKYKEWSQKLRIPDAAIKHLISRYRSSAKERNITWLLNNFQAALIMGSYCHYCGVAPNRLHKTKLNSTIMTHGIDRVDSAIGYEFENCVPCCAMCNRMKSDFDKQSFIQQCARIVVYHNALTEGAGAGC